MAIDKSKNTRVNITVSHKLHRKIQLLAREEMRSANSLMVYLMAQALQQPEWQEKIQALIDQGELEE